MNKRGFSIIEVIMAIVVFGVVMLSALAFHSVGHSTFVRAKEQTYALQIAHNEISRIRLACITTCPPFGQPSGQVKTVYTVPELSLTYTAIVSWNQVSHPFGTAVSGYAFMNMYDWYKVVMETVTWHSNIDNVDRKLSLCTTAAKSPRF